MEPRGMGGDRCRWASRRRGFARVCPQMLRKRLIRITILMCSRRDLRGAVQVVPGVLPLRSCQFGACLL